MAETKWKRFSESAVDREYLMLVSFLPLKHYWSLPSLLRYTRAIQDQLAESAGLVGYSLRVSILSKKGWTLSVWEDDRSLADFVRKNPHASAMQKLRNIMRQPKFVRKNIKGSHVPPNWSDALPFLD